jgi:hypothetical protein
LTETDRRQGSGRRGAPEFPLREREFKTLLEELADALRRSGLPLARQHTGSSESTAAVETGGPLDEQQAWEQRAHVREVAAVMFSQLERRLSGLSRTFGRLSEEERFGLAALLRLPESRRGVIGTMLRLPERDRKELSVGFRLSDAECRALADLLDSNTNYADAEPAIRVVDAAVAAEGEAPPGEVP